MDKNLDHEFDEYLKAHESEILESLPHFFDRLKNARFRYGRFIIPTFYKPHFLGMQQERLVKRATSVISQIINTAARLYFEEGHLSHAYRIPEDAAELIKIDPGYSSTVVFARCDSLLEGQGLQFVEFNCDSPAGGAYTDQLEEIFFEDKTLKPFFEEHNIARTSRSQAILDALLGAYEEFGGNETPNIAIVDWRHVRTVSEFEILKDFFEAKGYRTTVADPRELKYKSGKLYHKQFPIHILYRRFVFEELLERLDEVGDMVKAYRDHAICMVNPLRSRLASTKALLSILTNPEYDHFFTENQNRIKREFIPWTRRLQDAEDFFGHRKMYLIDFIKDHKESLILKPSTGNGGKDVTIGCESTDEEWNSAIDKALKGQWVIQEYVNIPIMTVPVIINRKLDFAYKKFNFNVLLTADKFSGGFVRLGDDSVINVARHGGLIPSMSSDSAPERFNV